MANSLADQLLRAGLVDEKQVQKARKEQSKAKKANKGKKGSGPELSESERLARQATQEKAAHDRELNRQREAERLEKERRAQLHDFLTHAGKAPAQGDVVYHFVEQGAVKRLYVDAQQHAALSAGRLAITAMGRRHFLLDLEGVAKLRELAPGYWYALAEAEAPSDPDDPYAEFQIPDDLMW